LLRGLSILTVPLSQVTSAPEQDPGLPHFGILPKPGLMHKKSRWMMYLFVYNMAVFV